MSRPDRATAPAAQQDSGSACFRVFLIRVRRYTRGALRGGFASEAGWVAVSVRTWMGAVVVGQPGGTRLTSWIQ